MFTYKKENKELRKEKMNLKASCQELRNENEELKLKEYRKDKKIVILEKALEDIKAELQANQYENLSNFENKIRKILADRKSKLESNNCK